MVFHALQVFFLCSKDGYPLSDVRSRAPSDFNTPIWSSEEGGTLGGHIPLVALFMLEQAPPGMTGGPGQSPLSRLWTITESQVFTAYLD